MLNCCEYAPGDDDELSTMAAVPSTNDPPGCAGVMQSLACPAEQPGFGPDEFAFIKRSDTTGLVDQVKLGGSLTTTYDPAFPPTLSVSKKSLFPSFWTTMVSS